MDAFRAAQADPRTDSQIALDVAVERVAQQPTLPTVAGGSPIEHTLIQSTLDS